MARRRTRLAKSHRSYSIAEAAELYGCHRNTVRLWMRSGLEPVERTKPYLFSGDTLNAFHAARRQARKQPCAPGEMYCFRCRKRQRPDGALFDYRPIGPTSGMVTAICPGCGGLINQHVDDTRLAAFEALAKSGEHGSNGN